MTQLHDPPIYSSQRLTTLIASVIVALASGTNYVFSAYGPQLGARLKISHTSLNAVALAGNIGVYSTGPIWGRIVDTRGPRILLASGFVFLLGGYLGMKFLYDRGIAEGQQAISTLGFIALSLFCYLTGAGGNAGLASSVNSTAKSFPDQMRATTTGLVISGFGLSAFFFSSISRTFFAGNASSFLLLLGIGTALPMVMGFFLVRHVPLPPTSPIREEYYQHEDDDDDSEGSASSLASDAENDGIGHRTPLLDHGHKGDNASLEDLEMSPSRFGGRSEQVGGSNRREGHQRSLSRGTALTYRALPNVHGIKLWKTLDFYILFVCLSLLSGTGIMYINNVGAMTQALYAHKNHAYNPIEAAKLQAVQVSTISITNCLGRIFIGIISDFCKNRFDIPRSYCLILVALVCFISQVVAARVSFIAHLWIASSILGLGYGAVFSLFPTVCLEWFGLPHFSENWGYLSISPIFAGNVFSLVFGYILDEHEDFDPPEGGTPIAVRCSKGLECYALSFYITIGATFAALLLTVLASWRDRKKIHMAGKRRTALLRSGGIIS